MSKNFYKKYAELLCGYCLNIQKGEHVLIKSTPIATPLLKELHKVITQKEAFAEYMLSFEQQDAIFYENSTKEQRENTPLIHNYAVKKTNAILTIKAPYDIAALKYIPESAKRDRSKAIKPIKKTIFSRSAKKDLKWCLCVFPNASMAANGNMSVSDYEKFVFKTCFLDKENPELAWKELSAFQEKLICMLNKKKQFHILGPDTNLHFSCKNRIWINSDGKRNMPSGEVFTGPVENSVNGKITFSYPSIYEGREIAYVTLVFKNGIIVDFDAKMGKDVLETVLKIPGANRLGEIAFGTNLHIQRATKEILFDEKIGGSIHAAIGASYPETGGKNKSAIHWDMIKDMSQGQVFADNELIYENGIFLAS